MPTKKVFWFYGRSGAGKSTLAGRLESTLADQGSRVSLLDGDRARALRRKLGYSRADRIENHRRIAEAARSLIHVHDVVIAATMAPEHVQRDVVKEVLAPFDLEWIFVDAPLEVCIKRDPKGLYKQSLDGHLTNLIEYPFDPPRRDEQALVLNTAVLNIEDCHRRLIQFVLERLHSSRTADL